MNNDIKEKLPINVIKNTPPIIFIDSLYINYFNNSSTLEKKAIHIDELYNLLLSYVNKEKIVCPEAEQSNEVNRHIVAKNNMSKFRQLTNGMNFKTRRNIQDIQLDDSYLLYCNNNQKITIKTSEVIYRGINSMLGYEREPLLYIEDESMKGKNVKSINDLNDCLDQLAMDVMGGVITNKVETEANLYLLKKDLPSNPNEQLFYEFAFEYRELSNIVKKYFYKKEELSIKEEKYLTNVINRCSRISPDIPDNEILMNYLSFLASPYYLNTPSIYIARCLINEVQYTKQLKCNDTVDIENISCYLPYCDYYLTDKAMQNFIQKLKLDTLYNVKFFSIKNLHQLITDIKVDLGDMK